MMNSLPLINTGPSTAQLALFLAVTFLAGLILLRSRLAAGKGNNANVYANDLSMSAFSQLDHPSLRHEEDVNPLTEAEIYVIYGRQNDAQRVLDLAMREGRITPAEVVCFWSLHKRG
ncbi:MAG: hypothetical protein WAV95_19330 [Azonexus sp.]